MNLDIKMNEFLIKQEKFSNCKKKKNAAVILIDEANIAVSSYNYVLPGLTHICGNCPREHKSSGEWNSTEECPVLHAEVRAVHVAAKQGFSIYGGVMYCSYKPCLNCAKVTVDAGIKEIIYRDEYEDKCWDFIVKFLKRNYVSVRRMEV